MSAPTLVRVEIPDTDHVVSDTVVQQYAFAAAVSPASAVAAVLSFLTGANTTRSMSAYLGKSRSRVGGITFKVYDLTGHLDGKHLASPVLIDSSHNLDPTTDPNELPDQCAAILAYHGVLSALPEHGAVVTRPTPELGQDEGAPSTHPAASRPRASLRGRMFFGPLNQQALTTEGDVSLAFVTDAIQAMKRLAADVNAWGVWSRTYQTIDMVTGGGGWVGNEFGVVRRRKDRTAGRTTFTAP